MHWYIVLADRLRRRVPRADALAFRLDRQWSLASRESDAAECRSKEGEPKMIASDNGADLTSHAIVRWPHDQRLSLRATGRVEQIKRAIAR